MKLSVAIKGNASGKITEFEISEKELDIAVLEFFVLKDIPIAYACFGKGQCKKCIMNGDELACQITLRELIEKFNGVCEIEYL